MVLAFLLSLNARSAIASVAVGQQSPWIDTAHATEYVDNLLSWYDRLVVMDPTRAGPASTLYHSEGHSFSVLVVKAYSPRGESLACFLFTPIEGNEPKVTVVSNMTMLQILPHLAYSDNTTLMSPRVTINGAPLAVSLIWVTLASNVLMDAQADSVKAAEQLYSQTRVVSPRPAWYDSFANSAKEYLAYLILGIGGVVGGVALLHDYRRRRNGGFRILQRV